MINELFIKLKSYLEISSFERRGVFFLLFFNLSFINIESEIFSIVGPNVNTTIKQLSLESQRGFDIKNLAGIFSYSLTSISIKQLKLKTDDSFINGAIMMDYKNGELSDFVNKVDLNIHFNEAEISTNEPA